MDVKQFYVAIDGNYQEALSRMMNDSFINRLVTKFYNDNQYNDIIDAYQKKDYQALFASIHSFKGVTGNLSLSSLFDIASTITEAIRDKEEVNIDNEMSVFKERFQLFIESYNKYMI